MLQVFVLYFSSDKDKLCVLELDVSDWFMEKKN